MQGGADAQLSRRRRSMQLHANPSNGRACIRFPSSSFSFSVCPTPFPLPFLRPPLTLSLSPLFSSSLPQPHTRLVTPPFSLHPRSMTSARGNASQRRLLSLPLPFSLSLSFFLFHSIYPAHSCSHLVPPSRLLSRAFCNHSASTLSNAVCLHRCGTFNRDRFAVAPTRASAPRVRLINVSANFPKRSKSTKDRQTDRER